MNSAQLLAQPSYRMMLAKKSLHALGAPRRRGTRELDDVRNRQYRTGALEAAEKRRSF
jgi:hypothetical protein